MSIDYRTLLAEAIDSYVGTHGSGSFYEPHADVILATRISDLCPDCKGSGINPKARAMNNALATELFLKPEFRTSEVCAHPNAPTIADLLRWGENVAKADQLGYGEVGVVGFGTTDSAAALLAALRTEADR